MSVKIPVPAIFLARDRKEFLRNFERRLRSHTLKAAESLAVERILCSKVKRKSAKVKLIEKKMAALKKHKDIFVKKHGEEVYEEKMSALVDDLLASEVNEDEIKGTTESIIG